MKKLITCAIGAFSVSIAIYGQAEYNTVTLHYGYSNATSTISVAVENGIDLPLPNPPCEGFSFAGWYPEVIENVTNLPEDIINGTFYPTHDTHLHAVWRSAMVSYIKKGYPEITEGVYLICDGYRLAANPDPDYFFNGVIDGGVGQSVSVPIVDGVFPDKYDYLPQGAAEVALEPTGVNKQFYLRVGDQYLGATGTTEGNLSFVSQTNSKWDLKSTYFQHSSNARLVSKEDKFHSKGTPVNSSYSYVTFFKKEEAFTYSTSPLWTSPFPQISITDEDENEITEIVNDIDLGEQSSYTGIIYIRPENIAADGIFTAEITGTGADKFSLSTNSFTFDDLNPDGCFAMQYTWQPTEITTENDPDRAYINIIFTDNSATVPVAFNASVLISGIARYNCTLQAPLPNVSLESIGDTHFTLYWEPVEDATSYSVNIYRNELAPATDLILSQYYDRTAARCTAIEIFNGTGAAIEDIGQYELWRRREGEDYARNVYTLKRSYPRDQDFLLPHNTAFLIMSTAAQYDNTGMADLYLQLMSGSTLDFSGFDEYELRKNVNGTSHIIDKIGSYQSDSRWVNGNTSLVRKANIKTPSTVYNPDEWNTIPLSAGEDHFTTLGLHQMDLLQKTEIENSPLQTIENSLQITGLLENTVYHYTVSAHGYLGCTATSELKTVSTPTAIRTIQTTFPKIWQDGNTLHIAMQQPAKIAVYSACGRLVSSLVASDAAFTLSKGFYIVTTGDSAIKFLMR